MGQLILFPVRHHSPAVALAVRDFIGQTQPEKILIEGPSDFNPYLAELYAPHRLPLAIYSHVLDEQGHSSGVYYPFCEYSPEWVALQTAKTQGIPARFIDMPWAWLQTLGLKQSPNPDAASRYSDQQLGQSQYVSRLCQELGVDGFDDLWDELFEIETFPDANSLVSRCAAFCAHCRELEVLDPLDEAREAWMAREIAAALRECKGNVLVLCGGFHAPALEERCQTQNFDSLLLSDTSDSPANFGGGIHLTPYSDERMDRLRNYGAGMPGPGYYRHVWEGYTTGVAYEHQRIGAEIVSELRRKGQLFSAADLIAAATAAQALATIRGHQRVWRRDIADGFRSAIVKDELLREGRHPLLDAIVAVFRGHTIGQLASGVRVPPLAIELRSQLEGHGLLPNSQGLNCDLDLTEPSGLARSRLLHRIRLLGIQGISLGEHTDMAKREDLSEIREQWHLKWSPDFEASLIEASRFGPTLAEAAAQALTEKVATIQGSAAQTAALLIEAALADLGQHSARLMVELQSRLQGAANFLDAAPALDHLLYLSIYDQVLNFGQVDLLQALIATAWQVSLYLLESMGTVQGQDRDLLAGLASLDAALRRMPSSAGLPTEEYLAVLMRVASDRNRRALLRGATLALLWNHHATDPATVLVQVRLCASADLLGDFLGGLFALGREAVQQCPPLLQAIDELISDFSTDEFLCALPPLRLAFSYFTSREKHTLARVLTTGLTEPQALFSATQVLAASPLSKQEVIANMAFETQCFELLSHYGLLDESEAAELEAATFEIEEATHD